MADKRIRNFNNLDDSSAKKIIQNNLVLAAINVGVVHVGRADMHGAEESGGWFVAIAGAVFGEAQRQVVITARFRRENADVQ